MQTPAVELKPRIARFWLSNWKLHRFPGPLARGGAGRGGGEQDQSILNLLSLGKWEGGDRTNFFSAAPWEKQAKS